MLKPSGSNYQGGCADSPSAGGIGHLYDAANLKQTAEEIFKRRQVRTTGLTSYFPGDFVLVLVFEGQTCPLGGAFTTSLLRQACFFQVMAACQPWPSQSA